MKQCLNLNPSWSSAGSIPPQWGSSGVFKLPPLQLATGQLMAQVFSLHNNRLTGPIPNFLGSSQLQAYQRFGVQLAVRPCLAPAVI